MAMERANREGDPGWNKLVAAVRGQFDLLEAVAQRDEQMLAHVRTVRHTIEDAVFSAKRAMERRQQ